MQPTIKPAKIRQGYFKKALSKKQRRDRRQLKERGYMPG
jgi:hypothetical protein